MAEDTANKARAAPIATRLTALINDAAMRPEHARGAPSGGLIVKRAAARLRAIDTHRPSVSSSGMLLQCVSRALYSTLGEIALSGQERGTVWAQEGIRPGGYRLYGGAHNLGVPADGFWK